MFEELIQKRRSLRKYIDKPVENEKVDKLVEAALRAPTSHNKQTWRFVVVTDPATLSALSRAKPHGAGFLANAPLGIVVCGVPGEGDVWIEDCSIAAAFIHLAATSLGLGSCWIQIRERKHDDKMMASEFICSTLGMPPGVEVEAIVGIGYPDGTLPGRAKETLPYDKVFRERFGEPY